MCVRSRRSGLGRDCITLNPLGAANVLGGRVDFWGEEIDKKSDFVIVLGLLTVGRLIEV